MDQAPAPMPIQGIRAPHVLNVEGNVQENWKIFKQKWNNYAVITNLEAQTRQYKTALLLHTLGDEALRIYNGFQIATPEDDRRIVQIIEKFDDFAIGEINVTYERFIFNKRNQQDGETFESFLTAFRVLLRSCNYCGDCVDSITRDRIVLGVRDQNTQSDLLKQRQLTLNNCIDICRAAENATSQARSIRPETLHKVTTTGNRYQRYKKRRNDFTCNHDSTRNHNSTRRDNAGNRDCKFCTYKHPMKKERCPAYGKMCNICKQENHFVAKCPNNTKYRKSDRDRRVQYKSRLSS